MSEDHARNVDESTEDNNDSEGFELGHLENEGLMNVEGVGNRNEDEVNSGILQMFDQMASPFRWVTMDLGLNFMVACGPSSSSAAPFLSTSVERGDLHNKRPKVNLFPLDRRYRFEEDANYFSSVFEDGSTSHQTGNGGALNNSEGNDCITTQVRALKSLWILVMIYCTWFSLFWATWIFSEHLAFVGSGGKQLLMKTFGGL